MSVSARLEQESVQLDAGGRAVIPLQIRNDSDIVEGYSLQVVGVPAAWATLEPPTVSLYPGDATTATVVLHPPRSSAVPAGQLPFGVRVEPTEHPDQAVVPEGVVEVLPFLDTTAELIPRTSRGRHGALHRVAVDNRGNVPLTVVLTGTPGSDALLVRPRPEGLTVPAGQAAFCDVRVRGARTLFRGQPLTHPFVVTVTPHDGMPVALDGSHVQEPALPASWLKVLLALLGLLIALAVLWFALLKPAVTSAAKEAVEEPLQEVRAEQAANTEQAAAQAQQAGEAARSAETAAEQASEAAEEVLGPGGSGGGQRLRAPAAPLSERLQVATGRGSTGVARYTVPAGRTLQLTDLVLQNPQGDFGRVTLSLGDRTLLSLALENFRDLDYHFVAPITAGAEEQLVLRVQCREVGRPPALQPAPDRCDTAVYFGGELAGAAAASPPPT